MKYPNDFLSKPNGPTAMGEAQARAIRQVDTPYLTKVAGNTITRKKGDFAETLVTGGDQQVVLWYVLSQDGGKVIWLAEFDMNGEATLPRIPFTRFFQLTSVAASVYSGRIKYIGDNFFSAVIGNGNDSDVDALTKQVVSWPMIFSYPGGIKVRKSGEPYNTARGVEWIDSLQVTGLPVYDHQPEMHATGWDESLKAYRYAFTFAFPVDAAHEYKTRAPVAFYGDTKTREMVQTAVPFYPGRDNSCFNCFAIGPARLQALITVTEDLDFPDMVPPYLVMSEDHGETWGSYSAAFLDPYLYKLPLIPANPAADPPTAEVRERFDTLLPHIYWMAKYHINVYVGNGKNILIIPNGLTGLGSGGAPKYAAMAFLGTAGGSYTRLSWPPDAWPVTRAGDVVEAPFNYVALSFFKPDDLNNQFGFGLGCMYLSVVVGSVHKLLITYDYGSTWEVKPYPPAAEGLTGGGYAISGCVVKPYVSADDPGELLFAYANYATGSISLMRTDGTFSSFSKTGAKIKRPLPLAPTDNALYAPSGEYNQYPTNFAVNGRSYIFPAYPGEFDKP